MNRKQFSRWNPITALVVFGVGLGMAQAIAAPAADDVATVLTRGPVHEAFAEVITFDPQPGVIVPKAPPDAINEVAPDQRPAGDNVTWIPGYWAWDDEQSEFLWVSGTWRFLPPGRQWIPGYWSQTDKGYQWTSGYWADAISGEIEYLPKPPALVSSDPVGNAPSANETWIPGVQAWNRNAYAASPGFWAPQQANWAWIPSHYVWSPRGYVFVGGYWDYSIARRGLLFAPVSFSTGAYSQPGFSYSPMNVINTTALLGNLFLRPSYGHYYFGDYYAASYSGMGFYPPYAFQNNQGYDPFYAQQSWQNRQNSNWQQGVKTQFQSRRDNEDARPPRTLAAQNELVKAGTSKDKDLVVATPLSDLAKSKDSPVKLAPVSNSENQKLSETGKELQNHRAERMKLEAGKSDAGAGDRTDKSASTKRKLPDSPIAAKPREQLSGDHIPPKSHEVPKVHEALKPDLTSGSRPAAKVEPKPTGKPTTRDAPAANSAPKAEPKLAPKPDPKVGPRIEPKPVPKPMPKTDQKPEPKPAPKGESQPNPKTL